MDWWQLVSCLTIWGGGLRVNPGLFPASAGKGVALGHFGSDLVLTDELVWWPRISVWMKSGGAVCTLPCVVYCSQ